MIQGGKMLQGEVGVGGAKNHALKILAASLLFKSPIKIQNVPLIEDIFRMAELLESLGVQVTKTETNTFLVDAHRITKTQLSDEITKRLRSSIVLAGPLLARLGRVEMTHPGGCIIGKRSIDLFIEGFSRMGVICKESGGRYIFQARKLHGTDFTFRIPSVTGTETLMMAAILAEGKTILRNVAEEPEILALAEFLNHSGARIKGAGTPVITIEGLGKKRRLSAKKDARVLPDRIEAGSLLILASLLAKDVVIRHCIPEHLESLISHLAITGVKIKRGKDWLRVSRPPELKALSFKTDGYPGFATDLQAPFVVLLTQTNGMSQAFETIFEGRLEYIHDLNRMGANITLRDSCRAMISGPTSLHGREMESPDLRAGLAFVIAALVAKGNSTIHNIYQIDRGYERIEKKLQAIGAHIKRVTSGE